MRFRSKLFIAADVTVPISTTYVDGTNFTSETQLLAYGDSASIMMKVDGQHASCSLNVIFKFATYNPALEVWDTVDFLGAGGGIEVAANGTTAVYYTIPISVGIEKIKLLSIQNQESVAGYTVNCNAAIYVKEK